MVRASRLDKDGVLQLNNGSVVRGMSGPPLNELNLELPLYIGSVPNFTETSRDSGVAFGLIGAIQRLIVNGQSWTGLGMQGSRVGRYQGPPCPPSANPCLNRGVCLSSLNTFSCKCVDGFYGEQCQLSAASEKPVRFNGDTFLEYAFNLISGKRQRNRRRTRFEVSVRSEEANGLLFWLKRGKNPLGNYVAVAISDGYPELNLKLGRHIPLLTVRSKVQVNDGEWHTLLIERWKRGGQIQVDDKVPDKVQAEFGKTMLNTNAQLWIGGAPTLPGGLPSAYYLNYNGCLQRLLVDKVPVNLLQLNTSLPTDLCDSV
uniref:EGF-like domain-containing protein n=2 Tax=Cuerna arida TaxID=1464854 RepID=A0A1B6G9V7_9HEMI